MSENNVSIGVPVRIPNQSSSIVPIKNNRQNLQMVQEYKGSKKIVGKKKRAMP